MAQAGFTPISLYFSSTASAVPSAGNLVAGELALNTVDEKLYFKNSAGTVKLLASNATSAPVLSFSAGTTGLTPNTATTGAVTLAGTLATTNGGTGLTSFTSGGVVYASSSSALATGSALTFDGTNLILGSANPLFQGSSSTGSASLSNNSAGAYVRVYGGSHATRANFTDFINASSTSTFDSAGNLGIGNTPSAWANSRAIQFGNFGAVSQDIATSGGMNVSYNCYATGATTWFYRVTSFATRYAQEDGIHKWFSAPSGTAGNAVTFTQAMTLDVSGQLLLGTTSNLATARRELVMVGASGALVSLGNTTTADRFQIVSDSGENALLLNKANTPMIFYTNNTQRFQIGVDGQFGIGGATYGTAGQVLTSGGACAAPTWAAAAGGGLAAKTCTFNSSGTWTKPSGYGSTARVLIQAWGGGASGAKTSFSGAGGGGGGAYNYRWISIACLSATETVTIGAGGAARTTCTCGATGGTTTFGSHVSAYGGNSGFSCGANFGYGGGGGGQLSGGGSGATPAPGAPLDNQPFYVAAASDWVVFEGAGALYSSTGGVFLRATAGNYKGGGGGASGTSNAIRNGAKSVWGGGGGGGARSTCGTGSGGTSSYGGNGGAAAQSGSAVSGAQPAGGGGAASASATSSGAGGAGRVVVTVYAGV